MLLIEHPDSFIPERDYIFKLIFQEFLGLEYRQKAQNRSDLRISLIGDSSESELLVADLLFQADSGNWLTQMTLPVLPLKNFQLYKESDIEMKDFPDSLPVIYGQALENGRYLEQSQTSIKLGIDLFGSAFFMLTRYEEIVEPKRDSHMRFAAESSLAHQAGFLERPIINEYLEVLWHLLKRLWPNLKRRERRYRLLLSHDVDHPAWVAGKSWKVVLKNAAGDLLRRRRLNLAQRRIEARMQTGLNGFERDPGNTFDFIMELSERQNLKSAFYFITGRTAGEIDGYYNFDSNWIRSLMKKIHKRGHEIGLHPSYKTYQDPAQLKKEFEILRAVCDEEKIEQQEWGGRQHFLRWENPTTWQAWEDAGLFYDSTLGFSGHIGFRCGICYEFPVFNLRTRKELALRERPLAVMDGTLFDYMNLTDEQARTRAVALARICKHFQGDFSLLWHNSELLTPKQKDLYKSILSGCV